MVRTITRRVMIEEKRVFFYVVGLTIPILVGRPVFLTLQFNMKTKLWTVGF